MGNFPQYVPTEEERDSVYGSLISKIYSILTKYEQSHTIEEDYVNWLCIEVQTYNKLFGGELYLIPANLMTLLNSNLSYQQIRKIILDSTNYISRALANNGKKKRGK